MWTENEKKTPVKFGQNLNIQKFITVLLMPSTTVKIKYAIIRNNF